MSRRFILPIFATLVVIAAMIFVGRPPNENPNTAPDQSPRKQSANSHTNPHAVLDPSSTGATETPTQEPKTNVAATKPTTTPEALLKTKNGTRPQARDTTPSSLDPISSGPMRASAAVGGRPAHALARVGSTEVRLLPDQEGGFQQLQAHAAQAIAFTVSYPWLKQHSEVTLGVMDGGTLAGSPVLKADASGNITFTFTTGDFPGAYRILLATPDGDRKSLEIWVDEAKAS